MHSTIFELYQNRLILLLLPKTDDRIYEYGVRTTQAKAKDMVGSKIFRYECYLWPL